ncbi:22180_t:CDS:2, partial [Gigaspora rosea]
LEEEINKYLFQTTNQGYLKMEYEKTLWPVLFLRRKQYCGVVHEKFLSYENNQIIITEESLKKRILKIIAKYIDDETLLEQCCGKYKKEGLICNNKINCYYCEKNEIQYKYWQTSNNLFIYTHVNDIADLGKLICEKCKKLKFCYNNAEVNNNCCFIENCLRMQ